MCAQQELPHDAFLNILDSALKLDMPKLQACCERYIAFSGSDLFTANNMAQHLPPESVLRIGDATRKAFLNLQAQFLDLLQNKRCTCSVTYFNSGKTVYTRECASCVEVKAELKFDNLSKYVPSSMEFLRMAQPRARIPDAGPDAGTADSPASAEGGIEGGNADVE